MIAAIVPLAAAISLSPAMGHAATAGQTFAPLLCPAANSTSNCNAQDVNTVSYSLNTELDTCTGPTDTGRSIINITYTQNARRYNITSINSVSGQPVGGGTACGETFLTADQGNGTYTQQATITYKCVDNTGNGTIDVAAVFNWDQTASTYVDPVPPTSTASVNPPKCTSLGFVDIQGLSVPPTFTVTKGNPSPPLKVGVESTYLLNVTTTGTNVGAEVKDQLPAGMVFTGYTASGWTCDADNANLVTCVTTSPISTGTASSISIKVKPDISLSGDVVTNYASVGGADGAPTPGASCTDPQYCASNVSEPVIAPVFTVSKSDPTPALMVNRDSTYTLTVASDTALAAEVKDQLPPGFTFVSASPVEWGCVADGSNLVTCSKAVAANVPEDIEVTVRPDESTVGQTLTNYASAGPSGEAPTPGEQCVTANCAANPNPAPVLATGFSITKLAPQPGLKVSQTSVYQITVTTDGTVVPVEVKDQLPEGLTFVSASPDAWGCNVNGSNLVSCQKTMSSDVEETISITVRAEPSISGQSVTNYASAGNQGEAPDPGEGCNDPNRCASVASNVTPAGFTVEKSAPVPGLMVGLQSVYTLTVGTDGTNVPGQVKDKLPVGLSYVSAQGKDGADWSCTYDGGSRIVTCNTESISSDNDQEIAVTVTTDASALGQDLTNYASAGPEGNAPEPSGSCSTANCDSNQAPVTIAGYTLTKSAPSPQLQVNRNSVYTLAVSTTGTNVPTQVKDQLPPGLSFVSASPAEWGCTVDGSNLVTCNRTISTGTTEQIQITVATNAEINAQEVVNYASAGSGMPDATNPAPQPGPACVAAAGVACASNASTVADIREDIKKAVEDDVQAYLGARLDQLVGSFDSQSRISRFRNTQCGVTKDLSLSGEGTEKQQNIAANGTFSMKGGIVPTADVPPEQCSNINVWAQLDVGYVDGLEDSSATGGMVTVGAEYLISDNFLAGVRLSLDYTDASFDSDANSEISGFGWLAGPYLSAEIAHNLFLDGFIGYGTSWNDYGGNYEGFDLSGDFTTQRIAGYVNMSGTWETGAVAWTPLIGASFGKEWSDSFDVGTDEFGDIGIDGQEAGLGRLKGRLEAAYNITDYADEQMQVFLAPQVTYDFVRNAGPDGEQLLGGSLWRGGVEGGFRYFNESFGASLLVGYDGVGVEDWNAYRGQLQLNYTW